MSNKINLLLASIISLSIFTFFSIKSDDGIVAWEEVGSIDTGTGMGIKDFCSEGKTLYAATAGSGVFRKNETDDNFVNIGLPLTWVESIHNMNGTLFAGTWLDGTFKTTGNGTWISIELTGQGKIKAFYSENGILLAGTSYKGVFRTDNEGNNWINIGPTNKDILALNSINGTIYASTAGGYGVFKTTNEGTNWTNAGLIGKAAISLCPANGVVYAGAPNGEVFKTSNGGANWTSTSTAEFADFSVYALHLMNNILYAVTGNGGIFETSDGGENWINIGLIDEGVLALHSIDGELFAGTEDGRILKKTIIYPTSESWIKKNWRILISVFGISFGMIGTIYGIHTKCFQRKVLTQLKTKMNSPV